eukprot:5076124-Pleurochrysis_carterae.AAC.1
MIFYSSAVLCESRAPAPHPTKAMLSQITLGPRTAVGLIGSRSFRRSVTVASRLQIRSSRQFQEFRKWAPPPIGPPHVKPKSISAVFDTLYCLDGELWNALS